jgi:hypothetical protein
MRLRRSWTGFPSKITVSGLLEEAHQPKYGLALPKRNKKQGIDAIFPKMLNFQQWFKNQPS